MRLVDNMDKMITPYISEISKGLQQLPSYATQLVQSAQQTYELLANMPADEVYQKFIEYAQQTYKSLKSLISDLYTTAKSVSATIGKDVLDAVVASSKVLEQQLVEFSRIVQEIVKAIRTTIANIQAGNNPQQEVTTLMEKLFGWSIDAGSLVDGICTNDSELCRLVESSMNVHRDIFNKYLV